MYIKDWFADLLCEQELVNNIKDGKLIIDSKKYKTRGEILIVYSQKSEKQTQTENVFGFKWALKETFESEASMAMIRNWTNEKYLNVTDWLPKKEGKYRVLDAGCGASFTALEYFKQVYDRINYIGVDISSSVEVASQRVSKFDIEAQFLQCDLLQIPLKENSLDVIFSEGVLHHTDSTKNALTSLSKLLRDDGLFFFYVYKKKGPIREFTDDYIREKLQQMSPAEAWEALKPITEIGIKLGELNTKISISNKCELLEIESGEVDLQRFFYWNIFKCFYRPEYTFDEMNHINFDWYAPKNAFRQSPEEVRNWCEEANLSIEREYIEEAGITIIARKRKS